MSSFARVTIHASQFPEQVRRDLRESLRSRQVNHKFHYDSVKQTQKWLALHQAYSPSRTDPDCQATYDRSFAAACARFSASSVHLVGLGCGGGQKDARLLRLLRAKNLELSYTPVDVSTAMVLVAREVALQIVPETACHPLVCDLPSAPDLGAIMHLNETTAAASNRPAARNTETSRLITFFGMIPNFEPDSVLPHLAGLVRRGDWLLFSANLAPGADYAAGVRRVLPLYDNAPTRDWLMAFLLDLGVERSDGTHRFVIEEASLAGGLLRIAAYFRFENERKVSVDSETFAFSAGDTIRLFFSYRHTAGLIRQLLQNYGLTVVEEWITKSGEEGVFLASRS